MTKPHQLHLLSHAVEHLILDQRMPPTNSRDAQLAAFHLHVADTLSKIADRFKKLGTTYFLDHFELPEPGTGFTELSSPFPFVVTAKRDNPRETLDKDEFIRAVSTRYQISAAELHTIAATTIKRSAPPTSIRIAIVRGAQDDDTTD